MPSLSGRCLHRCCTKWHHCHLYPVHFGAFWSSRAPPNLYNLAHTVQPVKSCWRHESASRLLSTGISTTEQYGGRRLSRWQRRRLLHQLKKVENCGKTKAIALFPILTFYKPILMVIFFFELHLLIRIRVKCYWKWSWHRSLKQRLTHQPYSKLKKSNF